MAPTAAASKSPPPRKSAASRSIAAAICPPVTADSIDAADSLLLALGRCDILQSQVKNDCDGEVAEVIARHAKRLMVDVAGQSVPIADYRKAVLKAIEKCADEHRDELLEGDAKSAQLNNGTLGWRKSPPSLAPVKGGKASGNADLLQEILEWINEKLARFKLFAAGVLPFLRVKVEFDKVALLKAIQAGEIETAELRRAGYLLDDGEEVFFAEPNATALASRSKE